MKAVVLLSGGLDSTLAARLIKDEGLEIIALNFKTPFCLCDRKTPSGCISYARKVADNLGIEFRIISITDEFLKIVQNPKHGRGSQMNPCIDCRILKFFKAKEFMRECGASFIVTGEVLGQRPMSQHKRALNIIDRESGLEGLVLRPLSAMLLPETIPEKEGWVRRETLLNFSGRTRRPQIELANKFGIKDYACPAGGCLLTDPEFARRVRDLIHHSAFNFVNVELLKIGRHFRLSQDTKLIVGRDEKENERLLTLAKGDDYIFYPVRIPGPTALGVGRFDSRLVALSCRIVCRYSDLNGTRCTDISYGRHFEKEKSILSAEPEADKDVSFFMV